MSPDLLSAAVILLLSHLGAFGLGAVIFGYHHWRAARFNMQLYQTEVRLRADDRFKRSGEIDRHPFLPPPLPTPGSAPRSTTTLRRLFALHLLDGTRR